MVAWTTTGNDAPALHCTWGRHCCCLLSIKTCNSGVATGSGSSMQRAEKLTVKNSGIFDSRQTSLSLSLYSLQAGTFSGGVEVDVGSLT